MLHYGMVVVRRLLIYACLHVNRVTKGGQEGNHPYQQNYTLPSQQHKTTQITLTAAQTTQNYTNYPHSSPNNTKLHKIPSQQHKQHKTTRITLTSAQTTQNYTHYPHSSTNNTTLHTLPSQQHKQHKTTHITLTAAQNQTTKLT